MSDQESSTAQAVVVELREEAKSFLDGAVDLKRLLRDVTKQSKPAVEALVSLLSHTDAKIKLSAATKLLDLQVEVSKLINADQIQRLIAEIRFNRGGSKTLVEVEDDRPLVDFTTIQDIK